MIYHWFPSIISILIKKLEEMHNLHNKNEHKIAVFGCGNILFGDDGAGPAVIDALERLEIPEDVFIQDVGTGIRDVLFDYLLEPAMRPELLIIVDAVDFPGIPPGKILDLEPRDIPVQKVHDFSLHQFPTVNMLSEMAEATATKVKIFAIQVQTIPHEVQPGLSGPVAAAVQQVKEKIARLIHQKI